jgi:hypothetical protein
MSASPVSSALDPDALRSHAGGAPRPFKTLPPEPASKVIQTLNRIYCTLASRSRKKRGSR